MILNASFHGVALNVRRFDLMLLCHILVLNLKRKLLKSHRKPLSVGNIVSNEMPLRGIILK